MGAVIDTAAILAKMGRGDPEPIAFNRNAYGPWFRMMSDEVIQTDEQLGRRNIGSLSLEAALGLPGAEAMNLDACVQKINLWARGVREYTGKPGRCFSESPTSMTSPAASF